jgi:hypothetical protein
VTYRNAGVLEASISDLEAAASKKLVRTSTAGRIERIDAFTPGDDVIGYAETDGRVHLHFGLPWDQVSVIGGIPPGGSVGDVQIKASSTTLSGVSPGTSGNVLTSNGTAWTSAAPASTSPGGNDKTVQYKNSTAFAGEAELTREAAGRFNATTSFFFTVGATGGSYPSYGFYRAAALAGDGDNTLDANYQIVAATQINSETVPIIGTYANSDGTKDLVIGGRFDWDTEETFQSITAWGDRFSLKIARFRYFKNAGASTPLRLRRRARFKAPSE